MTLIRECASTSLVSLILFAGLPGCGSDDAPEDTGTPPTDVGTESNASASGSSATSDDSATSATSDDSAASSGAAEGSESSTGADLGFDETAVLELAAGYATDLEQINATPFGSQHGLADTVNVFITPEHAAAFETLDPAAPSLVEFVEGTLIVKEHLDGDGAYDGYLLMYKAPEGYNPDAADWYWARVAANGNTPNTGTVGFCINCHAQVADTGYVFGVETDNRQ